MLEKLPPDTPPAPSSTTGARATQDDEVTWTGPVEGPADLSILVPTFRDDPVALIKALATCHGVRRTELVVYDDGSGDPEQTARNKLALGAYAGPSRLISAARNRGRSHARNRLRALARGDWLLLLDADMLPDAPDFLTLYTDATARDGAPRLIAGGFSLDQASVTPDTRLHAAQARMSDCLDAARRARTPGRFVFTSNILVHREILARVGFDDGFTGWGWEDVDWGLRVAAQYPVIHIDNTASHLGLDTDAALLAKHAASAGNFARLASRHPDAVSDMSLYRAARAIKRLGPLIGPFQSGTRGLAQIRTLPDTVRLFALKLHRAAASAGAI